MKTLIVYYSMGGNTAFAAEKLAETLGAGLLRLEPQTAYPEKGAKKFLFGGKSALMGEKPALKPYDFDADCERVIFGFPVWASRVTPPLRSFIEENRAVLQGKRFAAFACQMGSGGEKALESLRAFLGVEAFDAQTILIDPKDKPSESNDRKMEAFCLSLSAAE